MAELKERGVKSLGGGVRRRSGAKRWRRTLVPIAFLLPALVVFAYFKFIPMIRGIELSFYDVKILGLERPVGWDNYVRALGDDALWRAFGHTLIYVAVTVTASAILGLAVAMLLQGPARHLRIMRTAAFLPVVTAVAVVAEVWRILYWPAETGTFNQLAALVGMGPFGFLSDPEMALQSIMGMHVWKSIPYDMVIFVAGLAGINKDLYEAADIDGANRWQRFRHVTLPALRPTFVIVITLGLIRGFRVFTEVYVMTAGGPAGSSDVLLTYIYRTGFDRLELGYASAVSTMLFVFTAVLTLAYLMWSRRKDDR